jgi:hypothetical protein
MRTFLCALLHTARPANRVPVCVVMWCLKAVLRLYRLLAEGEKDQRRTATAGRHEGGRERGPGRLARVARGAPSTLPLLGFATWAELFRTCACLTDLLVSSCADVRSLERAASHCCPVDTVAQLVVVLGALTRVLSARRPYGPDVCLPTRFTRVWSMRDKRIRTTTTAACGPTSAKYSSPSATNPTRNTPTFRSSSRQRQQTQHHRQR